MESSAKQFELYFDISTTSTPDFKQLCALTVDFDQGETLDTFYTLCSELANNVKVAIDPTWSTSFKFEKSDPLAQFLLSKQYEVGAGSTVGVRIINKFIDEQLDFVCTISGVSYTVETPTVFEISFDIKIYDASTFVKSVYNPSA